MKFRQKARKKIRKKTKKKTDDHAESTIDFAWILFIATKKLGLSRKEAGRLQMEEFNQMYRRYQDDFDLEMKMKNNRIYYKTISNSTPNDYGYEETIDF